MHELNQAFSGLNNPDAISGEPRITEIFYFCLIVLKIKKPR